MAAATGIPKVTAKLLAFPALLKVPPPDMPLEGKGLAKYREIATALLKTRKLNFYTRARAEMYAVHFSAVKTKIEVGQRINTKSLDAMERILRELQIVDGSEDAPPETARSENRYAHIGVTLQTGTKKT